MFRTEAQRTGAEAGDRAVECAKENGFCRKETVPVAADFAACTVDDLLG